MAGEPGTSLPASGVERAALAYSALPTQCADTVNQRLTVAERVRLREGLTRVRNATDEQRKEAVRLLAEHVKRGRGWPRPAVHDDADCPFRIVQAHPRPAVIEVLERIVRREPLAVAVTLCHLPGIVRDEIWDALSDEARAAVEAVLGEVFLVSPGRTRTYARDLATRLTRAMRAPTARERS
jgi:hypothetical protein